MDNGTVFWIFLMVCVLSGSISRVAVARIKARERSGSNEVDTRTSQEIYRSLQKMEKRIEALETLLIESEKQSRADRIAAEIERL